jgi:hypothetical protein
MLGDQIGESAGKATSMKVLPGEDYRYVKMEVTIQETGKVYGVDGMNMGTYVAFERVRGQLFGEGQGIIATGDGESAIWNGHGVGRMTGQGMGMSFRFSIAYQAPQTGNLARLNEVLVIGEHEVLSGASIGIAMSRSEYEQVRSDALFFVIKPGHGIADVETVVEEEARFEIVRKHEAEGRIARETDPRG